MPFKTILFLLFLLNLVFSQSGCTQYQGKNGLVVDITSLQGVIFNATNIYDSSTKSTYNYEFVACGNIPNSKMAQCPSIKPITSLCQEWSEGASSLGVFISAIVQENTLVIDYNNGDEVNGVPRSLTLTITCDPNVNTIDLTTVTNIMGTVNYVATATSKYACPVCLKCNGHGQCTSLNCICDGGYSGAYCNITSPTSAPPIDPIVTLVVFNVVEGIIIVALVSIIIFLYIKRKSYTSMN